MTDRAIILSKDGDKFTVRVDPAAQGEDYDRTFDQHKAARGWAGGLRLTHRWPIRDLSGEGA